MRSRRGGTCGGNAHPQPAQSSVPASPPHPHENSPPPSSPHRHYPQTRSGRGQVQASMATHSDFRLQTAISPLHPSLVPHLTQFRFQSNLNRPIITTNVTIIFFEESEQHSAQMRYSEAQLQEKRSQGVGLGFEKRPKDECRGVRHGRLHAKGDLIGDVQQIGDNSAEASIMMALAGSSSGTQPAREPPGGVAKGDAAEEDEDWGQYAYLIIEETPNQDDNK